MTIALQTTRVVLVDDHPAMRAGVRSVLERTSDIAVVGEASTGEQAMALLRSSHADVVFLDIGLPDIDGIALLGDIGKLCPDTKVIILSCQTDQASVRMAVDGGANGYLSKNTEPHEIVDAVHSVLNGQAAISPDVATHLISAIRDQRRMGEPTLTTREREVWRALARGLSNADIARALYLSEHTVKFHIHNLLGKMGLKSRSEAICAAHRRGLGTG
jgi:two-component system, NarL family, response regulator LiaR